jgi:pyruvate, water dikinase
MRTQTSRIKSETKRSQYRFIRWFETLDREDVAIVGGKNASLGEMIQSLKSSGIRVPEGFATTAEAYWAFLEANELIEPIRTQIQAFEQGRTSLMETGKVIRRLILKADIPPALSEEIRQAYSELCERYSQADVDVAVRSSATAEDLPEASFAGQQESYLNISGEAEVLQACQNCFASLFTDRAISYRDKNGFDHMKIALSAGVQKMVRSDKAGSGVMFSIDTETGFPNAVLIDAAWGIGESVVQGTVTPDEYLVFKPLVGQKDLKPIIRKECGAKETKVIYASGGNLKTRTIPTTPLERKQFVLQDHEILELAQWAVTIEHHYGTPMDMEWAKDGETGELFVVQARPETVQSRMQAGVMKAHHLKETGPILTKGISIGSAIAGGKVCHIEHAEEMARFEDGDILVTRMTEPDWVPIIRKASAIVTDTGGRTSHAAIVSREYGIPAVVGCGNATQILHDGQMVTVSCAEGSEGLIYAGKLAFEEEALSLSNLPGTRTQIMMNVASPAGAFQWWQLPVKGIGLARMEFIINNIIQIHPLALTRFEQIKDKRVRYRVETLVAGYADKTEYFVEHLARGLAQIAAVQHPHPVLIRTSDFKTNEYASLIGGEQFETHESNPMLGFRGASRYYSEHYRDGFALECRAIKRVREEMGFQNVIVMIPFCRTPKEAEQVLQVLADNGLRRGENGLQVYMMAEIPSNVILAPEFVQYFDGFSIGSNDLTQLVLGIDRDSEQLAPLFDERNEAVKQMIRDLIRKAHAAGRKVGICGQAPSDYPEFAHFLVKEGIDSISLNPDSILKTLHIIAEAETGSG